MIWLTSRPVATFSTLRLVGLGCCLLGMSFFSCAFSWAPRGSKSSSNKDPMQRITTSYMILPIGRQTRLGFAKNLQDRPPVGSGKVREPWAMVLTAKHLEEPPANPLANDIG